MTFNDLVWPICAVFGSASNGLACAGFNTQESCAIAKMTAQCALHMGALKIFETPWDSLTMPTALFPTFSWAFVLINPMNVPTKFEVRSFTRS